MLVGVLEGLGAQVAMAGAPAPRAVRVLQQACLSERGFVTLGLTLPTCMRGFETLSCMRAVAVEVLQTDWPLGPACCGGSCKKSVVLLPE